MTGGKIWSIIKSQWPGKNKIHPSRIDIKTGRGCVKLQVLHTPIPPLQSAIQKFDTNVYQHECLRWNYSEPTSKNVKIYKEVASGPSEQFQLPDFENVEDEYMHVSNKEEEIKQDWYSADLYISKSEKQTPQ